MFSSLAHAWSIHDLRFPKLPLKTKTETAEKNGRLQEPLVLESQTLCSRESIMTKPLTDTAFPIFIVWACSGMRVLATNLGLFCGNGFQVRIAFVQQAQSA